MDNGDNQPTKIPIHDIPGLGAFLEHRKIHVNLKRQDNGRVIGEVPAIDKVYRLMGEFQSNPSVLLLDYLADQRRLRGRMLDLRDGTMRNGIRVREMGKSYGNPKRNRYENTKE
jgi:hypothetical protein